MDAIELLIDLHRYQNRQGPGSKADTLRAFSCTNLSGRSNVRIADIGCGTGGQSLTLANAIDGHITAVDIFDDFLSELDRRATNSGLADKITTLNCPMDSLPFDDESLDAIWSEGAIYHMGFESGINSWKRFLRPGGYLVVSEITWITENRPFSLESFWKKEYPEIGRASDKINILEKHGFSLSGYFVLPADSWIREYYEPLEHQYDAFLSTHHGSDAALQIVRESREEAAYFEKNQAYYSYGFYIARRG